MLNIMRNLYSREKKVAKLEEVTEIESCPPDASDLEFLDQEQVMDEDQALLCNLVNMAPYFFDLYGPTVSRAITDKEKFIFVIPSQVSKLGVKAGDPVKPGSSTDKAMKTGQRVVTIVPSSVYGQPYIATAIPIKNNSGHIIGSMVTISLAVKQEKFAKMASELNEAIEGIAHSTANIVASSQQLVAGAALLAENSGAINQEAKNMDNIINLIDEVAKQTHLLGLNASIEAARAGEMGRGFNVVAEEIRKLVGRTSGSVNEVNQKLLSIQEKIALLEKHSEEILAVTEVQVSAIEAIEDSIKDIQETAGLLNEEAKDFEMS